MDLVGLSQALTLPHNPVQPNFAIIRLPRGTNVPAFYALLCQFGFADVKFTVNAEGWQDSVPVESEVQQMNGHATTSRAELVREDTETPLAPSTSTSTPISAPTSLPQVFLQLSENIKSDPGANQESQSTSPVTPANGPTSTELEDAAASTSVEDIVKTVLGLQKVNRQDRVSSSTRGGNNGYTRCQKCSRLLSTTSGSLISHAISHYPVKRFGCPSCGVQFFKKSMYIDHVKSSHSDEGPLQAIDLRTENPSGGSDAIRNEWRRVATECFPNHAHLFKNK